MDLKKKETVKDKVKERRFISKRNLDKRLAEGWKVVGNIKELKLTKHNRLPELDNAKIVNDDLILIEK